MSKADMIITNGRVITMDRKRPFAEALAIKGNKIMAVGSAEDVKTLSGPKTRVVDAKAKTVMPGIIEGHVHLFGGSVELDLLDVSNINGLEAIAKSVSQYRKKVGKQPVLVAIGAKHTHFGDGVPITRQLLDKIHRDEPFALACFDHHTVWANTKALEYAGLIKGKKLPPGNEVVLDKDGLATGELREPAAFLPLMLKTSWGGRDMLGMTTGEDPKPYPTRKQQAADIAYLKRGIEHANSLGITSMHNMDGNHYQLELLHRMEKAGELNTRIEIPFHQKNYFKLNRVDEAKTWRKRYHSDMLHCDRVKVFMDGVLETQTALMLNGYEDDPSTDGAPLFTAKQFNELAARIDKHKLQIAVHAIGDGAVRRTLNGFEHARKKNGKRDSRHRVEHIELIDPADIPRFKKLGVVASIQPNAGVAVPGNPHEPILSRIGKRLPHAYAWQTIRKAGAVVAFSSDWPVLPLDPFYGMQCAMTVEQLPGCPDQRQSLMDTLHAFTAAGAYMEFAEKKKGKLKKGMLADVIVLDADLEDTDPSRIAKVKPVITVMDGRVVFER